MIVPLHHQISFPNIHPPGVVKPAFREEEEKNPGISIRH
jgi:hypothetical protein